MLLFHLQIPTSRTVQGWL